jgi:hypothetical protein
VSDSAESEVIHIGYRKVSGIPDYTAPVSPAIVVGHWAIARGIKARVPCGVANPRDSPLSLWFAPCLARKSIALIFRSCCQLTIRRLRIAAEAGHGRVPYNVGLFLFGAAQAAVAWLNI